MNSDFEEAVDGTLKNEGELSNNKYDPGGITKYGISLRFLKEIELDINHDKLINAKDILDLTEEDAKGIYKIYFWQNTNIFLIDSQMLANKVFDLSVNMGAIQAIKLLQEALNMNISTSIGVDGIIGRKTLNAINNVSIDVLMKDYKDTAAAYYKRLVAQNPNLQIFFDGWIKRAYE